MYYELYADSLLLVNFVMNLYLLLLVNRAAHRTATRRRLILGAGIGAVLYLLPFLCGGPAVLRFLTGALTGMAVMVVVAFRIRSFRAFRQIIGKLFLYSFLMGGCLLFLIRSVPFLRGILTESFGVMGAGAVIFLALFNGNYSFHGKQGIGSGQQANLCKVTLVSGENSLTVTALIDSGNSLVEPVSGKPVSVVDREAVRGLWRTQDPEKGFPTYFRAIPYHSIGKKRGILQGYPLEEMQIELDGMVKICREVYIALGQEDISDGKDGGDAVRMILNPRLLEE